MPSSPFGPVLYGLVPAADHEGLTEALKYIAEQLREAKSALLVRDVAAAAKAIDRADHTMRFVRTAVGDQGPRS